MRIIVRDLRRKVNHLSKVVWDRKIITEFNRSISSTRTGKPVLMMDVKVSKDKHIRRWVDGENLIYVRWNRIKNRVQRRRRWLIQEKEVRQWLKPVENISKTLQSFLEISLVQKEVLLSHKLRDHAYKYYNPFGLKEDNLLQRKYQNQLSHPGLSHIAQGWQEILVQGKIHNHRNSNEGLKYL